MSSLDLKPPERDCAYFVNPCICCADTQELRKSLGLSNQMNE